MPTKRCVFIEKICNNSIVSPLSEIFFVLLCCKGGSEYERSRIEIDYRRKKLLNVIGKIADYGAFERFFRSEGKMNDRVVRCLCCVQNSVCIVCDCPTAY